MINILELKNRALNSRLVNDSFWALLGNVIGKGLALAAGIIVARFLGKDIYGEYGIIRNTLISIAIFSTFGIGYTATKYVAEYKNSKPEYIKMILSYSRNITLLVSGIMAVSLLISAAYVAEIVLKAPYLTTPLRFVAIWIVFNAITTTQIGILAGFGEFKGMARINTIVGIITFLSSLILTYYWQLNGALAALLISQILNWYLNYLLVKKYIPKETTIKYDKLLFKDILKFSFPVALQEGLFSITSWITSILIIRLSTYGELGLYSAAMQWNAIILFIPGILRNVVLSHLASNNNNKLQHNRVLKIMLLFSFVMTTIPLVLILLFSKLIAGFYGKSFEGLSEVINLAVFTTIFSSLSGVYVNAFMSIGKNWIMLSFRIGRDVGIVIISYFLLTRSSSSAGALSVIYAMLFANILFLFITAIAYSSVRVKTLPSFS